MPFDNGIATGNDIKTLLHAFQPEQTYDLVYVPIPDVIGTYLSTLAIPPNFDLSQFVKKWLNLPFFFNANDGEYLQNYRNIGYLFERYPTKNDKFADTYSIKLFDFFSRFRKLYPFHGNNGFPGYGSQNFPQVNSTITSPTNPQLYNLSFDELDITLPNNDLIFKLSYYIPEYTVDVFPDFVPEYILNLGRYLFYENTIAVFNRLNFPCMRNHLSRSFVVNFETEKCQNQVLTIKKDILINSLVIDFIDDTDNGILWEQQDKDLVLNQIPSHYLFSEIDIFFDNLYNSVADMPNVNVAYSPEVATSMTYEISKRYYVGFGYQDNLEAKDEILGDSFSVNSTIPYPEDLYYQVLIFANNNSSSQQVFSYPLVDIVKNIILNYKEIDPNIVNPNDPPPHYRIYSLVLQIEYDFDNDEVPTQTITGNFNNYDYTVEFPTPRFTSDKLEDYIISGQTLGVKSEFLFNGSLDGAVFQFSGGNVLLDYSVVRTRVKELVLYSSIISEDARRIFSLQGIRPVPEANIDFFLYEVSYDIESATGRATNFNFQPLEFQSAPTPNEGYDPSDPSTLDRFNLPEIIVNNKSLSTTITYNFSINLPRNSTRQTEALNKLLESLNECYMTCNCAEIERKLDLIVNALDAEKFAVLSTDDTIQRTANLGYYIERISRILGISVNEDGSFREIRPSKLIEKGNTIPAGWGLGQWERNQGGSNTGQRGGSDTEDRDGIAYEIRSNNFATDSQTGEPNAIAQGGYALVENIPQLLHIVLDDLDRALGWQDAGANAIPSADGSQIATYQGLNRMILDILYNQSSISRASTGSQISSLKNQAMLQEILAAFGFPATVKEIQIQLENNNTASIPVPSLQTNSPTVNDLFMLILLNMSLLIGTKFKASDEFLAQQPDRS